MKRNPKNEILVKVSNAAEALAVYYHFKNLYSNVFNGIDLKKSIISDNGVKGIGLIFRNGMINDYYLSFNLKNNITDDVLVFEFKDYIKITRDTLKSETRQLKLGDKIKLIEEGSICTVIRLAHGAEYALIADNYIQHGYYNLTLSELSKDLEKDFPNFAILNESETSST